MAYMPVALTAMPACNVVVFGMEPGSGHGCGVECVCAPMGLGLGQLHPWHPTTVPALGVSRPHNYAKLLPGRGAKVGASSMPTCLGNAHRVFESAWRFAQGAKRESTVAIQVNDLRAGGKAEAQVWAQRSLQ